MRKLVSLQRDEEPIAGEVYRYKNVFLKCIDDSGRSSDGCRKCFFDTEEYSERCGGFCGANNSILSKHFERVLENEVETAADVKFRHVEETKGAPPLPGERFIAAVGLVEYVGTWDRDLCSCRLCDLTQRECDEAVCGSNCHYERVKR